ncbi:11519_t:CDS:2, partial [Gigaspora margarita]
VIRCYDNQLTILNLSNLEELWMLDCSNNYLNHLKPQVHVNLQQRLEANYNRQTNKKIQEVREVVVNEITFSLEELDENQEMNESERA